MIPSPLEAPSTPRARSVQAVLSWAQDTEHQYLSHRPSRNKTCNPWMPFQIGEFLSFMAEIMAVANGAMFLDVGGGPGTKPKLAEELFGLIGAEIEVDGQMAQAASLLCRTFHQDALGFEDYGSYDIVWLYRPFSSPWHENELELEIMGQMKPGAILAGGDWEMEQPPPWITVIDDWSTGHRGAWMKPAI